ncbi:hypothetical protein GRAN_3353 [Granulicella sibirica]|uniref:Uncharacterized protein n=1 Tax=Granulicella sibirica TaxID=2479048 RepID=A0A4Q0T4K3_9BACT|nr:hypothetical protein GRAN_3353 [Granulicella sibirica]
MQHRPDILLAVASVLPRRNPRLPLPFISPSHKGRVPTFADSIIAG